MAKEFVHLHLHTEYSLLDGFARIDHAVDFARSLDMPALAITDHGVMFGVIDFYRKCRKEGIKPIIGMEAYLTHRGRKLTDKDSQHDRRPYHLLLIAKNETGYRNLCKLASISQLEGYYYRPRIDADTLAEHSEGIIATSGCLAAEIPRMVEQDREDEARQLIGWYQDVFGKDNFFLELQQHDIPQIDVLNNWLLDNSPYAGVPLLATNDVHYVRKEDFDLHDVLLCIQTSSLRNDENRMRFDSNTFYMRTAEEMWDIFGDAAPESLWNTMLVTEMCEDWGLDDQEYHLPIFPVPQKHKDAPEFLRYLCEKGLKWRYKERASDPVIMNRLNHELGIINDMGFATYFLIVWDLCEFARSADIWWNVRGSGAGSLVAYSLGITALDPLENALIFERFLNPGRVSMPDFDLDYPEDRRAEMIEYCTRKYGEDKVAAIITFGTLGARGAIKDVARVLDMPLSDANYIANMVPTGAKPPKIYQLLGDDPDHDDLKSDEFIQIHEDDRYTREVIDFARGVEGVPRHASTHAAGIIVADRPLVDYIPLHRPTKGESDDNPVKMVTQFPMETAESIGLLKIDFLGLSTLTIMRRACDLIEKHHGKTYDMSNIPFKPVPGDEERTRMVEQTFEMLGEGKSVGVFQLESSGMQQTLRGMRPKNFENIIAAISLYRPGPLQFIEQFNRRLHGEEKTVYLHPALEPILSNTYGIIVYQEQIMQIAAELFGYDLGEADLMRRAVSKKKEKDLEKHRAQFKERGPAHNVDEETAEAIFEQIAFFANYGFNKSHAADYAVITCQTAFLKCHYPHEYMSALLSVYYDNSDKLKLFIDDCRSNLDIEVRPPDVNASQLDFDIEELPDGRRCIRFGMGAIKNVGISAVEYIIEQRESSETGAFLELDDFLQRCDMSIVGKRALEALIKVGALDEFASDEMRKNYEIRPLLLNNLERIMAHSIDYHRNSASGQTSMFDLMESADDNVDLSSIWSVLQPPSKKIPRREQLEIEKELMGLYISEHPFDRVKADAQKVISHTIGEIKYESYAIAGRNVTIAGLVADIRQITTRKGDAMAIIQIEDDQDLIECVMFPRTWIEYKPTVKPDHLLIVRGKADERNGDMQIIVDSAREDFEVASIDRSNGNGESDYGYPHRFDSTEYASGNNGNNGHHTPEAPPEMPPLNFDDEIPPPDWDDPTTYINIPDASPPLPGERAETPVVTRAPSRQYLTLYLQRQADIEHDQRRLNRIHKILGSHPGDIPVRVLLESVETGEVVQLKFTFTVATNDDLFSELQQLTDQIEIEAIQ